MSVSPFALMIFIFMWENQMISVFYVTPTTSRSETLLLTLPGNLGLVFGAMLLICFGNAIGHWKHTLVASFVGMVFWGGLIGLVTPYNKGLMIAFTFLEQTFFGWYVSHLPLDQNQF